MRSGNDMVSSHMSCCPISGQRRRGVAGLQDLELQESIQLENGTECVMPELDPFSEDAMRFDRQMDTKPEVVCEQTDWVECYFSKCYVVSEKQDKVSSCEYRDIIHVDDGNRYLGPIVKLSSSGVYDLIHSDHVQVTCFVEDMDVSDVKIVENKAGFRPVSLKTPPGRQHSLDVLILVLETASRNGFIRRMPKSYRFLTEKLGAVVLKSFNILGDGTVATIVPLLTGKTALESCANSNTMQLKDCYFEKKSLIFHTMGEDGYRTAFFEDMPHIGTFQHRFAGFKEQPADHYLRSLMLEVANRKKWYGSKEKYCMGAVPQYAWMLNLTSQFFKLDGKHFCFTFIVNISHDNFNFITVADDGLVSFLQSFRDEGMFENTLMIVMGDHGVRFDRGIRNTYQGKLEERLPLLSIVLPEKLKRIQPDRPNVLEALKSNVDVLTTPFDVHATLLDAVGLREHFNVYQVPGSDLRRAMTLLEPIPKSRTCGEAGVTSHWCACADWHNVSSSEPIYERVGIALADYINKMVYHSRSLCQTRKLNSIQWVMRRKLIFGVGLAKSYKEFYQAKIVMRPGTAVFEGTMVYNTRLGTFRVSEMDISRTSPCIPCNPTTIINAKVYMATNLTAYQTT